MPVLIATSTPHGSRIEAIGADVQFYPFGMARPGDRSPSGLRPGAPAAPPFRPSDHARPMTGQRGAAPTCADTYSSSAAQLRSGYPAPASSEKRSGAGARGAAHATLRGAKPSVVGTKGARAQRVLPPSTSTVSPVGYANGPKQRGAPPPLVFGPAPRAAADPHDAQLSPSAVVAASPTSAERTQRWQQGQKLDNELANLSKEITDPCQLLNTLWSMVPDVEDQKPTWGCGGGRTAAPLRSGPTRKGAEESSRAASAETKSTNSGSGDGSGSNEDE